ncbi:ATP-dependent zinc metalloprotease FtsH [Reinekea thalattae]|uniref:ATP-dependent zinc metalloprotease FtsH n=1 Tax=Reinekea thalattae TaxID=2593301 RepID=A0A5C8Z3G2_9GAMM|nr:ATP-dependent zinc metalloprotease FtsH [Reinekea thalattae]TXR51854.1 ATP-dependent zinc metalloprotease FtsH [Reinekea thalattae]
MAKNLILWVIIAVVLIAVFNNFDMSTNAEQVSYSRFVQQVEQDQVRSVTYTGLNIRGELRDGSSFATTRPEYSDPNVLIGEMIDHGVDVSVQPPEQPSIWTQLFLAAFPILIILGVFMFFMRQMQGGAGGGKGGPMSFGKSKARLLSEDQINTTFKDVAGVDEAKEDVQELVDFLRDPGKYQRLGGKIPRGVLMVGQPGTGKTLLAKAIAGEAKVPFFSISGSDFVEMFVGVGASRVRDMFEQAKKQAPCIIFIDEIDAVGRSRGAGIGGGNDEREQTLNQLLVEMDGFEVNDGIIVIAATNRPDVLDPALKRPGRFDREVVVGLPDVRGREQILKVHMRKVPVGDDVDASVIARGTPGFSGADLANLINEAALFAARLNRRVVTAEEIDKAKDKITMGAERKNKVMSEEDKLNTAYHESGHAIVAYLAKESDPIHKVTIIPRGQALGFVQQLPEADQVGYSRQYLLTRITIAYGGRIAEEMTVGWDGATTGASQDISYATGLARQMVTKWGFSKEAGPVLYEKENQSYLGSSGGTSDFSPETMTKIDAEVRKILTDCYDHAKSILEENRDKLETMTKALMEYETIFPEQIEDIMAGREPGKPKGWEDRDAAKAPESEPAEDSASDSKDDSPTQH